MAEYHVGAGLFGIYAGTLNPKGDTWRNKSEVTLEALCASAQYLLENDKEYHFQRKSDGKWFAMRISEIELKEG
jgi:hypothetical protein